MGVEAGLLGTFKTREGVVTMPQSKHKLGLLGFLENNILLRRPRALLRYAVAIAICGTCSNRNGGSEELRSKRYISGQNRIETIPLLQVSFLQTPETRITLTYYDLPAPSLPSVSVVLQYFPLAYPVPLDLL